jgi:hypothetical protein
MKKLILSFVFAMSLTFASAQSLSVENSNISTWGSAGEFELVSYANVTNNSGSDLDVRVKRIERNMTQGMQNAICWVQCYIPSVSVSPDVITIPAGGTVSDFSGHLYPNGVTGGAVIDYVFFDDNNPLDSVVLTVTYDVYGVGLDEASIHSDVYPNPASDFVMFDFNASSSDRIEISIFDMLGNVVLSQHIETTQSHAKIDVRELSNGAYFYQFRINGTLGETKRLIISH